MDTLVHGPAGRLAVDDDKGQGLSLLFLHSLGGRKAFWNAQLSAYRGEHRRAVAFDLRGMGSSEPARDERYDPEAMALDVAAVVDTRGLERVVLIGHSYGAAVAAAAAACMPSWVAGVVLVDAGADVSRVTPAEKAHWLASLNGPNWEAVLDGWFGGILKGAQPHTRSAVMDAVKATSRAVVLAGAQALTNFDLTSALDRYRGPRLAIGAADLANPFSLHIAAPETPHVTVGGASHWLAMDAPTEVKRHIDRFLTEKVGP